MVRESLKEEVESGQGLGRWDLKQNGGAVCGEE